MVTFGSPLNLTSGLALARAAEAMLRALGGCEVLLRFRGAAISNDTAANKRLGLASNLSEDVSLSPVVVRSTADNSFEFVIAASTLDRQVELRQAGTAKALVDSALGIVKDGKLLRVSSLSADFHSGAAYLYRVTARE